MSENLGPLQFLPSNKIWIQESLIASGLTQQKLQDSFLETIEEHIISPTCESQGEILMVLNRKFDDYLPPIMVYAIEPLHQKMSQVIHLRGLATLKNHYSFKNQQMVFEDHYLRAKNQRKVKKKSIACYKELVKAPLFCCPPQEEETQLSCFQKLYILLNDSTVPSSCFFDQIFQWEGFILNEGYRLFIEMAQQLNRSDVVCFLNQRYVLEENMETEKAVPLSFYRRLFKVDLIKGVPVEKVGSNLKKAIFLDEYIKVQCFLNFLLHYQYLSLEGVFFFMDKVNICWGNEHDIAQYLRLFLEKEGDYLVKELYCSETTKLDANMSLFIQQCASMTQFIALSA